MTDNAKWLAGLKVGDPVIVQSSHFASRGWLEPVARLTATQIVVKRGSRFRRIGGNQVGRKGYYGLWLEEPTAKRRDAIKADELRDRIKVVGWKTVPLDTLEAVLALVSKAGKAER